MKCSTSFFVVYIFYLGQVGVCYKFFNFCATSVAFVNVIPVPPCDLFSGLSSISMSVLVGRNGRIFTSYIYYFIIILITVRIEYDK